MLVAYSSSKKWKSREARKLSLVTISESLLCGVVLILVQERVLIYRTFKRRPTRKVDLLEIPLSLQMRLMDVPYLRAIPLKVSPERTL